MEIKFSQHLGEEQRLANVIYDYHINDFDWPYKHSHEDMWEFTIPTAGSFYNVDGKGQKTILEPGAFIILTTKDVHSLERIGRKPCRYMTINCAEAPLIKLMDNACPQVLDIVRKGKNLFRVAPNIISEIKNILYQLGVSHFKVESWNAALNSAVLLLLSSAIKEISFPFKEKSDFERRLEELKLEPNFSVYSVKSLCESMNYSRVQLNRLFQHYLGISPHSYLLQEKINRAQELLFSSNMSTLEVASEVGFSSLSQFNNDFKKATGLTPGAFRKKSRNVLPLDSALSKSAH